MPGGNGMDGDGGNGGSPDDGSSETTSYSSAAATTSSGVTVSPEMNGTDDGNDEFELVCSCHNERRDRVASSPPSERDGHRRLDLS